MRKINLVILSLCVSAMVLFGMNTNEYNVSNITYTEGDINLIGEKVSVKGIDEGNFHILSTDGEKVRLLADFSVAERYSYNSSGDGDVPVAFENSMLFQGLQDNTKTWKSDIENSGGRLNIYLVDVPTLDDLLNIGNFESYTIDNKLYELICSTTKYRKTANTPEWLTQYENGGKAAFLTKTIDNNGVYYYCDFYGYIALYNSALRNNYGGDIRPILETSMYNLSSENPEIQNYFNSIRTEIDEKDNQSNDNVSNDASKTQVVKVPSTGIDAPIIFTVVGLAVVVIAGIIIWVIVKDKRAKK